MKRCYLQFQSRAHSSDLTISSLLDYESQHLLVGAYIVMARAFWHALHHTGQSLGGHKYARLAVSSRRRRYHNTIPLFLNVFICRLGVRHDVVLLGLVVVTTKSKKWIDDISIGCEKNESRAFSVEASNGIDTPLLLLSLFLVTTVIVVFAGLRLLLLHLIHDIVLDALVRCGYDSPWFVVLEVSMRLLVLFFPEDGLLIQLDGISCR